jgi:hypothetical protein
LLHPAEVLHPGQVAFGAGIAGQFKTESQDVSTRAGDTSAPLLDTITVAPGASPYIAGRVGITGGFEGGLTYTGRQARIDGRKAFPVGPLVLSLGLGGSVLLPKPLPGDIGSVYGGGGDLPVLLGWASTADLYAVWFGPRAGFEILGGRVVESAFDPQGSDDKFADVSGHHVWFGGLAGFRVGFRYFHAALELDVDYHLAGGKLGTEEVSSHNLSIAPAGAMILSL